MKFGIRGGHSPYCKGARGIIDEQAEVREIANIVRNDCVKKGGNAVVNCDSNAPTEGVELYEGTNKANNNNCDEFISIHMNAGGGAGAEIYLYDSNYPWVNRQAEQILKNLSALGFTNRGIKYNKSLHDLNATTMPAMLIEVLFVDNKHDVDLFHKIGYFKIAEAISAGLSERRNWNTDPTPIAEPKQEEHHVKVTLCDNWLDLGNVKIHVDKMEVLK